MDFSIATATESGGGPRVASFGSGNEGGRLQAHAQGRNRTKNASSGRVRAVRSAINRHPTMSTRAKKKALDEIRLNTNGRGNIKTGILADIHSGVQAL